MLAEALSAAPGILLAEYVPGAFGARGLNVPFCRWLARIRRDGTDVRVMFHEPFFYFGMARPWRNVFAVVQRAMAAMLLRASTRVYYSTETWPRLLAPYGPQTGVGVLPIPATIPVDVPADAIAAARTRRRGAFVFGHFGTYGDHVGRELDDLLPALLRRLPDARALLVGAGSEAFARTLPSDVRARADATGWLRGMDAASVLRACDLPVQLYPDGVTTRCTSVMASLTTSVPVLTTAGFLTERVWATLPRWRSRRPATWRDGRRGRRACRRSGGARGLGARGRQVYETTLRPWRHDRADAPLTPRRSILLVGDIRTTRVSGRQRCSTSSARSSRRSGTPATSSGRRTSASVPPRGRSGSSSRHGWPGGPSPAGWTGGATTSSTRPAPKGCLWA
jgi:hypothetical protein